MWSGGLCFKTCSLTTAADCRNHSGDLFGDYECRGWNNLSLGGVPVTTAPICEEGGLFTCDFLSTSSLDCSSVGSSMSNPTNMACRSLGNTILTNSYDPLGRCLDNTASGTTYRSPLPTP
jgi:hypothetical protein